MVTSRKWGGKLHIQQFTNFYYSSDVLLVVFFLPLLKHGETQTTSIHSKVTIKHPSDHKQSQDQGLIVNGAFYSLFFKFHFSSPFLE